MPKYKKDCTPEEWQEHLALRRKRYRERELSPEQYRIRIKQAVEATRRWRSKQPPEEMKKRRKAYRNSPGRKEQEWVSSLRRKYGLTLDQIYALFPCTCPICNMPADNVDHHHDFAGPTSVRGVLCGDCNRGLGLFKDNYRVLRRAADYIEEANRRVLAGILHPKLEALEKGRAA